MNSSPWQQQGGHLFIYLGISALFRCLERDRKGRRQGRPRGWCSAKARHWTPGAATSQLQLEDGKWCNRYSFKLKRWPQTNYNVSAVGTAFYCRSHCCRGWGIILFFCVVKCSGLYGSSCFSSLWFLKCIFWCVAELLFAVFSEFGIYFYDIFCFFNYLKFGPY